MKRNQLILLLILFQRLITVPVLCQTENDQKIKEIEKQLKVWADSQAQYKNQLEELKLQWIQAQLKKYAIPKVNEPGILVYHSAMALYYQDKYGISRWVAHIIMPDIISGGESRTNDFRQDSLIPLPMPDKIDYYNSGYDRGHLAPSADFNWSKKAVSESFYYSNMTPQKPEFNRGKWSQVEDFFRKYVIYTHHAVFVVTGGIVSDSIQRKIGVNKKIIVPPYFYKIAVDMESKPPQGIGFYMLNGTNTKPITEYAVSIDDIEKKTNIDFFPDLPDTLENRIEAMNNIVLWQVSKNNVKPLDASQLPKGAINTSDAEKYVKTKTTVCGTVVATKVFKDKGIAVNLDAPFPECNFSFTIWQSYYPNFSYNPAVFLNNKKVCVTGKIELYKDKPTMSISNEKEIDFLTQ